MPENIPFNVFLTCLLGDWHKGSSAWQSGGASRRNEASPGVFLVFHPVYKTYHLSYVCKVVQYTVSEDSGKVNGIGKILHPYSSQTPGPIWMPFQIYHCVHPGSRCAKFDLNRFSRCRCARVKIGFGRVFLLTYPFLGSPTGNIFRAVLTLSGSTCFCSH